MERKMDFWTIEIATKFEDKKIERYFCYDIILMTG